jgi:hypothetical protein
MLLEQALAITFDVDEEDDMSVGDEDAPAN